MYKVNGIAVPMKIFADTPYIPKHTEIVSIEGEKPPPVIGE